MLIFSSFDDDSKFFEVQSLADCENIESDSYAFIRISSGKKEDLESYFKLGKELHKHDISYAVLLDSYAVLKLRTFEEQTECKSYSKCRETSNESNFYYDIPVSFSLSSNTDIPRPSWSNTHCHYKPKVAYIYGNNDWYHYNNHHKHRHSTQKLNKKSKYPLPLKTLLFMFAKHGASFFILDEKNYRLLPMAQTIINHYLLDIKLLGLVDSYVELENIASWIPDLYYPYGGPSNEENNLGFTLPSAIRRNLHHYIGIDGVVEKSLLIPYKKGTIGL